MSVNVPVIEELELRGRKYVRLTYGPSLTYLFPLPVYQYILNVLKKEETLAVPVFALYTCSPYYYYSTVIGPVKVYSDDIVEAGMYKLNIQKDDEGSYAEIPTIMAEIGAKDDSSIGKFKEVAKDYEITLRVVRKLDTYEKFEYVNLGGRRCVLYHLKDLYFAKVLSGGVGAPQAFILTTKKLKEGSFVRGRLFTYKAGRADFYSSGTSHQVHYVLI